MIFELKMEGYPRFSGVSGNISKALCIRYAKYVLGYSSQSLQ